MTKPGTERRRAKRRDILDAFSFFVSVPSKGPTRLPVHDVSDLGMRFSLESADEPGEPFSVKVGDALKIRLYLNQSLSLPFDARVARIESKDGIRILGVETSGASGPAQNALQSLLALIDQLAEVPQVDL